MSILIKGMEIPENCTKCDSIGLNVAVGCPVMRGDKGRATDCPLIEIPPHGRLIDVDEFEKYVELEYETREISHPNWIKFRVWCGDQPTIIEAEE